MRFSSDEQRQSGYDDARERHPWEPYPHGESYDYRNGYEDRLREERHEADRRAEERAEEERQEREAHRRHQEQVEEEQRIEEEFFFYHQQQAQEMPLPLERDAQADSPAGVESVVREPLSE